MSETGEAKGFYVVVVLGLTATAMGGCLSEHSEPTITASPIFLAPEDGPAAEAQGFRGATIQERTEGLELSLAFTGNAGLAADRLSCQFAVSGPVDHLERVSVHDMIAPAPVLGRSGSRVVFLATWDELEEITWFPAFDAQCSTRVPPHPWIYTETVNVAWEEVRRLGSRDYALGVGPFFTHDNQYAAPSCGVAVNEVESHDVEYVCLPRNELAHAAIWQDEEFIYLEAQLRAEALPEALLRWNYQPAQNDGPFRVSETITYYFGEQEARTSNGTAVESGQNGNTTLLIVPWDLVAESVAESIRFSIHLFAQDAQASYMYGFDPPPYLLR